MENREDLEGATRPRLLARKSIKFDPSCVDLAVNWVERIEHDGFDGGDRERGLAMRMRATHTTPRRLQAAPGRVILVIALVAGSNSAVSRTALKPSSLPGSVTGAEQSGRPGFSPTLARPLDGVPLEASEVTVNPSVPPVPGARVVLNVQDLAAAGVRYRWVQSEGPPVAIEDPDRPSIEVTIPGGAPSIGFLLVATSRDRVRIKRVTVPIPAPVGSPDPVGKQVEALAPPGVSAVRADAGDDQLGVIGHRVTLNATDSRPATGLAYRWVQLSGPPIAAPQQERAFYSFVPSLAGLYRFALLVAVDSDISEPDEVTVLVGHTSPDPGPPAAPTLDPKRSAPVTLASSPTIEQILGMALPRLTAGPAVASQVADVFESIGGRADLFTSFAELQDELRRRLDVVIPAEPLQRQAWLLTIFQPLTMSTTSELAAAGLDLHSSQGLSQRLTPQQRQAVRSHFVMLARAFRAVTMTERAERQERRNKASAAAFLFHPLMTPTGRSRATFFEIPALSTTSTTWSTSL